MARLPFSAERLENHEVNLRSDRLPVRFEHQIREINDSMDDIAYNTIDVIQERSRDSGLRTFYFNLMSDDNYRNKDFEKIVGMIADIVDISVSEGKFRDVRDAILPVVEDVVTLHIGYLTEDYPALLDYVSREAERDISRAVRTFEKYMEAVRIYRRNGNQVPRDGGRRDDRRDDRDDRRGRANFGSERDDRGGARRDRWDRGAVRGGVHGSPRRSVPQRDNRFGNSDQSDRFDDASTGSGNRDDDRRDDRRDERRGSDRFEDMPASRTTRRADEPVDRPRAHVQRLPGRTDTHSDVEDALARESQTQGNSTMASDNTDEFTPLLASENQDIWLPTLANPHPFVFNHTQELYYVVDAKASAIIPRIVNKDKIVDYYSHASMAMGPVPKDFARFDDGVVNKRLNELHTALINPKEEFVVNGGPESVTYHSRFAIEGGQPFLSYGLKDSMVRLGYHRFVKEREQPSGEKFYSVELATAQSLTIESFTATPEESDLLEELRQVASFTKLAEKMRTLSKKVRPELWLQLDRYLTQAVVRILRQNLSIPKVSITSFTSDWLELFSWVTEQYGEGYRDAINTHQEREIRKLLNSDAGAEIYVLSQLPEGSTNLLKPFVMAVPTKIVYINEVGFNLDVDMVPDVASQILPESNPFFHELALDLLNAGQEEFGRFYIQTSDLRVIEASRSFINEKAILLRMIK